jgi:uncharacterized RDD family membrane protein YckC
VASNGGQIPGGLPPALDQLTIETPEQTPLEFPLAGIGSRCLALAVDSLIQFIAFSVAFVLGAIFLGFAAGSLSGASTWIVAVLVLLAFLLYFGYFAVFEALWNGQTPGKRNAGIRVMKDNGAPITVGDAVSRNLLRPVDQIPGMYGVGIVSMLMNRQNKRLGDFVAGTVVVHESALEGSDGVWSRRDVRADQGAALVTAKLGAARLTAEEFQLVETFLDRRDSLEAGVRYQMALQIAHRVGNRLGVPPDERRSPEVFLEALASERRT